MSDRLHAVVGLQVGVVVSEPYEGDETIDKGIIRSITLEIEIPRLRKTVTVRHDHPGIKWHNKSVTGAGAGVPSGDLLAGQIVTWTHVSQRGSSINMTTREGKIVKRSAKMPECYIVRYRGKDIRIHESHLRKQGERTTLTEFVMGREAAKANGELTGTAERKRK